MKTFFEEECPRSRGLGEETRAKLRFSISKVWKPKIDETEKLVVVVRWGSERGLKILGELKIVESGLWQNESLGFGFLVCGRDKWKIAIYDLELRLLENILANKMQGKKVF